VNPKILRGLVLGVLLTLARVHAQSSAPSASAELPSAPEPTKAAPHAFWDRENKLLFAGVAAFRGVDFASTRNMRARGRDEILLNNGTVDNLPAFAAIEVAGTAVSVGLSYWMHRTGHHRIERCISIGHISGAAFGTGRNYLLTTKHRGPGAPLMRLGSSRPL
jgi:hypothetical protein